MIRWTQRMLEILRDGYAEGVPLAHIADQLRITTNIVLHKAQKLGLVHLAPDGPAGCPRSR